MEMRRLYRGIMGLCLMLVCACGQGGDNGSLALTTSATGPLITATAKYANAGATNLSGVEINFSTDLFGPVGSHTTDSTGTAVLAIRPVAFNGTKTITIIANTGNLTAYSPITMSGRTLTLTPPPNQGPVTATGVPGSIQSFSLSSQNFVAITDPFSNEVTDHQIQITASFTSTPQSSGDQLTFNGSSVGPGVPAPPASVSTGASGIIALPGASLALIVPNVGVTKSATITWTATDSTTLLSGSGSTVITITR